MNTYIWTGIVERLERNSVPLENGCIVWTSTRQRTPEGYGMVQMQLAGGGHRFTAAHRIAYMARYGEIPRNRYVLHTCNRKDCINPAHLTEGSSADARRQSIERGNALAFKHKTHCPKGHRLTKDNLRKRGVGRSPRCRECNRIAQRAHHKRTYKPRTGGR